MPQLVKFACLEPVLCDKISHHNEKTVHGNKEQPQLAATRENTYKATTKNKLIFLKFEKKHVYGIQKNGTDKLVCQVGIATQTGVENTDIKGKGKGKTN